jgi:hypothetical protein
MHRQFDKHPDEPWSVGQRQAAASPYQFVLITVLVAKLHEDWGTTRRRD